MDMDDIEILNSFNSNMDDIQVIDCSNYNIDESEIVDYVNKKMAAKDLPELIESLPEHFAYRRIICVKCNYTYKRKDDLKLRKVVWNVITRQFAHKLPNQNIDKYLPLSCPIYIHQSSGLKCKWKFMELYDLYVHLADHWGRMTYTCELHNCKAVFQYNVELQEHLQQVHSIPTSLLGIYSDRAVIHKSIKHRLAHEGFFDRVLEFVFKDLWKTTTFDLQCTTCYEEPSGLVALIDHIREHLGYKPFMCKRCEHAESGLTALIEHIRSHHPEDLADRKGTVMMNYVEDSEKHRKVWKLVEEAYEWKLEIKKTDFWFLECTKSECSYRCGELDELVHHFNEHYGICTYTCRLDGCTLTFGSLVELKAHMRDAPHYSQENDLEHNLEGSKLFVSLQHPPAADWLHRRLLEFFCGIGIPACRKRDRKACEEIIEKMKWVNGTAMPKKGNFDFLY